MESAAPLSKNIFLGNGDVMQAILKTSLWEKADDKKQTISSIRKKESLPLVSQMDGTKTNK